MINLLEDQGILNLYRNKIGIKQASDLFYMRYTYVDKVHLQANRISMDFNNVEKVRPIEMRIAIEIGVYKFESKKVILEAPSYYWELNIYRQLISSNHNYSAKIYFTDPKQEKDILVYYGKWSKESDYPF